MTLYENTITRDSNLDKPDDIQNAYENMLTEGGKEKSATIREVIKKNFKLTSRDVGVKTGGGAMSTAIRVTIKTVKALPYMQKIKAIGSGQENIHYDQYTQTILGGGNTFVFVELDWKFRDKLVKKIEAEIAKNVTDEFMHGEGGGNSIKVYGIYTVVKDRQSTSDTFWVSHPKKASVGNTYRDIIGAAGGILSLMLEYEDEKNLKKLG